MWHENTIILILNHMYWGKSHKLKRQHNNNYHILVALSLFLLVPMRVKLWIKLRREPSTTEASKASIVKETIAAEVEVVRCTSMIWTSTLSSVVRRLALLLLLVLLRRLVALKKKYQDQDGNSLLISTHRSSVRGMRCPVGWSRGSVTAARLLRLLLLWLLVVERPWGDLVHLLVLVLVLKEADWWTPSALALLGLMGTVQAAV